MNDTPAQRRHMGTGDEQLSSAVRVIYCNEQSNEVVIAEYPHREASEVTAMSDIITVNFHTTDRSQWDMLNGVFAWEHPVYHSSLGGAFQLHEWATAEIFIGERP